MNRNKKRNRKSGGRICSAAAACALGLLLPCAVPGTVLAASPPFAYTEEKWAALRDNKLEFDEIADLIHEYNSTVKKNAISYENYKGKDSDEIAQEYYDTADEIYSSIEYPDSDDSNYGSRLAAAQSSEMSADQMMERGDENVTDADTVLWGYNKAEKSLVQSAQNQMISYWNSIVSLESSKNAVEKAQTTLEMTQLRAAAGSATQTDVLNAEEALLNAQASVAAAESSIASAKEKLCLSMGWSYGANAEIGELPEPAAAYSSTVNLEADIAKAVENNYDLKILNRQIKNARTGTVQREYEATLKSSEEAVKSNIKSAYQALLLAEIQYEQALQSFELEEKAMQSADRKKAAGTISPNVYTSQQYTYADAAVQKETAAMSLLKAQLTYQWAVEGLASTA